MLAKGEFFWTFWVFDLVSLSYFICAWTIVRPFGSVGKPRVAKPLSWGDSGFWSCVMDHLKYPTDTTPTPHKSSTHALNSGWLCLNGQSLFCILTWGAHSVWCPDYLMCCEIPLAGNYSVMHNLAKEKLHQVDWSEGAHVWGIYHCLTSAVGGKSAVGVSRMAFSEILAVKIPLGCIWRQNWGWVWVWPDNWHSVPCRRRRNHSTEILPQLFEAKCTNVDSGTNLRNQLVSCFWKPVIWVVKATCISLSLSLFCVCECTRVTLSMFLSLSLSVHLSVCVLVDLCTSFPN